MLTVPVERDEALSVLKEIRTAETKCTMFVFGNVTIAENAKLRENTPLRQVAFVPEPSVLDGVEGYEDVIAKRDGGAAVVTMTLEFEVSSSLEAEQATINAIEKAFQKAQQGKVSS
jgi:hypothetical protein